MKWGLRSIQKLPGIAGIWLLAFLCFISSCKDGPTREDPVLPDMDKSLNLKRSLRKLDSVEERHSSNPEFYYYRGHLFFEADSLNKASENLKQALQLHNAPKYHFELAKVLLKQEKYRESWFHARIADQESFQRPLIPYVQARALLYMGYPVKGLREVQRCLEAAPNLDQAKYLKALLHYEAGQWQQSIRITRSLMEKDLFYSPGVQLLAVAYHKAGKRDSAMQWIREGLIKDSADKFLHYRKGLIHKEWKQWGSSLRAFREMYRLDSTDYRASFQLGKFAYQSGRYRDALKYLSKAVLIQNDSLEAHRYLARSYERLGQHKKALEEYRFLKSREPSNTRYQQKVNYLERRTQRPVYRQSVPTPEKPAASEQSGTNTQKKKEPAEVEDQSPQDSAGASESQKSNTQGNDTLQNN